MFESTGLIVPIPGPVTWTATTDPPGYAERMAVRAFRAFKGRAQPWWLLPLGWTGYSAVGILREWPDVQGTGLYLFIGVAWWLAGWTREGFCQLLDRYDAELKHRANL